MEDDSNVERKDGGSAETLPDELKKVRSQLRGNLVPEARTLVGGIDLAALLRAPLIWILACGSWHDHLAFASLGAALQRAGYRVKVFGVGSAAGIFARLGLSFEAIDAYVALHRHNRKAREFLKAQSRNSDLQGGGLDKEEEFLLELHLLRHEATSWITIHHTQEKIPPEEKQAKFLRDQALCDKRFNDFFLRAECSDTFKKHLVESLIEVATWRSRERRVSIENYMPIRTARNAAFRAFLRQLGEEAGGYHPIDVLECLRKEFSKRFVAVVGKAVAEKRDTDEVAIAEVSDFMHWQLGESPREWWERWKKKLPAWKNSLPETRTSGGLVPVAMQNMLLTMENLEPQERPQLVLYRLELSSVALMLEAQYQMSVALAWPWLMPANRPAHMIIYNVLAGGELKDALPFTPVRDLGPMAFSELLRSQRQISGQTLMTLKDELVSLELRSSPVELQMLRDCCTGVWSTDGMDGGTPLLPADDPMFFGEPGERELAVNFLTDSSDPPVCLSWGKRGHPDGHENLALLVAKSLKLVGRRGIFLRGRSGARLEHLRKRAADKNNDPELLELAEYAERQILFLSAAPHSWLLPQCACTVHAGGHGTTQSALRAGVPQILMPPFKRENDANNGRIVKHLGCGVEATPLKEATAELLAENLRSVLESASMKAKAADVAKTLRKEPGVLGAVAMVANLLRPAIPQEPLPKKAWPWLDGTYALYLGGQRVMDNIVRGPGVYMLDGAQIGWMKLGSFRHERKAGLPPGHVAYTIMVMWTEATHVGYGTVSTDGKRITWDDGNYHDWVHAAPPAGAEEEESGGLSGFIGGIVDQFTRQMSAEDTKSS